MYAIKYQVRLVMVDGTKKMHGDSHDHIQLVARDVEKINRLKIKGGSPQGGIDIAQQADIEKRTLNSVRARLMGIIPDDDSRRAVETALNSMERECESMIELQHCEHAEVATIKFTHGDE